MISLTAENTMLVLNLANCGLFFHKDIKTFTGEASELSRAGWKGDKEFIVMNPTTESYRHFHLVGVDDPGSDDQVYQYISRSAPNKVGVVESYELSVFND